MMLKPFSFSSYMLCSAEAHWDPGIYKDHTRKSTPSDWGEKKNDSKLVFSDQSTYAYLRTREVKPISYLLSTSDFRGRKYAFEERHGIWFQQVIILMPQHNNSPCSSCLCCCQSKQWAAALKPGCRALLCQADPDHHGSKCTRPLCKHFSNLVKCNVQERQYSVQPGLGK